MESGQLFKIGVIGTRGVGEVQGGIERYCSSFYGELCRYGFDVTIFVRRTSGRSDVAPGIRLRRVAVPSSRSAETVAYSVASVLAAHWLRLRTIHVHGIGPCIALPLAKALGMRAVVRHLGPDYERTKWGPVAQAVLKRGEQYAARYADTITCLNTHIAARFSHATGRTDSVHVIPNGVACPAALPTGVLNCFGVTAGQYVLSVGRLVPEKNMHLLIQAFLRADLPRSVKLIIVGDYDYPGPYSRMLKALCAGEDRVSLVGTVFSEKLWSLYLRAGLFVLASSHEGMSFSLLEAASAGLKVVASDIPANASISNGFFRLVPANSVPALRNAIRTEWARRRSPAEIQRQADHYRKCHSWPDIARRMTPLFLNGQEGAHRFTGMGLADCAAEPTTDRLS
jgi:alpha-maltose-1-phosphate synthase